MNTVEYIAQSEQFENKNEDMIQRVAGNADVAHAVVGIGDEFLEFIMELEQYHGLEVVDEFGLFKEKVIKEAGDMFWYIAILCRKYNLTIDKDAVIPDKGVEVSMVYSVQSLMSMLKKMLFYGKELNLEQLQFYINVIARNVCGILNVSLEDIFQRNYEKLSARYNNQTFSAEAAINKNETNE